MLGEVLARAAMGDDERAVREGDGGGERRRGGQEGAPEPVHFVGCSFRGMAKLPRGIGPGPATPPAGRRVA